MSVGRSVGRLSGCSRGLLSVSTRAGPADIRTIVPVFQRRVSSGIDVGRATRVSGYGRRSESLFGDAGSGRGDSFYSHAETRVLSLWCSRPPLGSCEGHAGRGSEWTHAEWTLGGDIRGPDRGEPAANGSWCRGLSWRWSGDVSMLRCVGGVRVASLSKVSLQRGARAACLFAGIPVSDRFRRTGWSLSGNRVSSL